MKSSGSLRLYNTLERRIEPFQPASPPVVRLYTCGPTVYGPSHIGNLRTFLFEDLLRRTLRFFGYQVEQVMNLTDIEDKIIAGALEQGVSLDTYTEPHIASFFRDLEALGVEPAEHYPRATQHIDSMIEMIEELIEKGHAYENGGSVYFRIESFANYGRLSRIDLSQVRQGQRVADDEYDKEDARDFVLWKAAKDGEPAWDSRFGPGRPGWHLECSAMSRALLGNTLDIHCGGVDNIFPHHENEIAQSECASGSTFVRCWLHSEHLLVDNQKMSKSLGNQHTLSDLTARDIPPRAMRYLLLSVHYRKKINFTFDSAATAVAALARLDQMRFGLNNAPTLTEAERATSETDDLRAAAVLFKGHFRDALADDLNVSGALGALFTLSRTVNRRLNAGVSASERTAVREALTEADQVLGVLDPDPWQDRQPTPCDLSPASELEDDTIEQLLECRRQARKNRDFAEADRIRDQLTGAGLVLEDTSDGTRWRRR